MSVYIFLEYRSHTIFFSNFIYSIQQFIDYNYYALFNLISKRVSATVSALAYGYCTNATVTGSIPALGENIVHTDVCRGLSVCTCVLYYIYGPAPTSLCQE